MPSRIDKLTEKQKAAMPAYRDMWIAKGLQTGNADWETFDKYMPICYEKAGIEYPSRIVRVASPLVGALAAAVAEGIWRKRGDAVDTAVRGAVDTAVDTAVRGAVDTAVRGAVDTAVGSAVRGAVDTAVGDAVDVAISIAKKAGVTLDWHYWLGGQFWVGGWYWGSAFLNFFFDVCKLKLTKDIMERAEAYRKINESVNYIWPNRNFVIVCDRPKIILRDSDGRLHSTEQKAIEYKDGWGLYMIHGVKFTEEQFNKAKTATVEDILSWEDIDQRSVLLRERPVETLLENIEKKLVDKTEECGGYELWELDLKDVGKTKILSYKSWSTEKPYVKFVPSNSTNALETVASLRHQTVEELKESLKS